MLIPFGILSAAGAGGGEAAGAYELISTQILGSSSSTVTFDVSTFASTYKHLQIRAVTSHTAPTNSWIRLNADTGSNYAWHELGSNVISANTVFSQGQASDNKVKFSYDGGSNSSSFSATVADLLDCFSTTKNTTVRLLTGTTDDAYVLLRSGVWLNTAATTSITLTTLTDSFQTGSRFSIYGIKGD